MKEVQSLIDSYYEESHVHLSDDERTKKQIRFLAVLRKFFLKQHFHFLRMVLSIHRKLFQGVYQYAGKVEYYNITQERMVLMGKQYIWPCSGLEASLNIFFAGERV